MDGTVLTSFRSIARGMWCARESWSWKHEKNSLKGHNNLTKLNAKTKSICVSSFNDISSYGFGRTLAYQRGALQRFYKFSNKFSEHLNNKERRSYHSNHISDINYLDKHFFLMIFIHKHQVDKRGIKYMQANHRNHVEQVQHIDSWVWF